MKPHLCCRDQEATVTSTASLSSPSSSSDHRRHRLTVENQQTSLSLWMLAQLIESIWESFLGMDEPLNSASANPCKTQSLR